MNEQEKCPECGAGVVPPTFEVATWGDNERLMDKRNAEREERNEYACGTWQLKTGKIIRVGYRCLTRQLAAMRDMLVAVTDWINAECVCHPGAEPIGSVVPGCRGIVERIGAVLEGKPDLASTEMIKKIETSAVIVKRVWAPGDTCLVVPDIQVFEDDFRVGQRVKVVIEAEQETDNESRHPTA